MRTFLHCSIYSSVVISLFDILLCFVVKPQSISITNEVLTHYDGWIDFYDDDWLTFTVSGNTGGENMMVRYGVMQTNGSYRWSQFYIVSGAFSLDGFIPCGFGGWVGHSESYVVKAELRTYSNWTSGDLVDDDVAGFGHN